MALSKRSFKTFVVEEFGGFPHFVLWAVLEWILIASLYIDGLLAFFSTTFANFFELEPPCVLCTRVDHILVGKEPNTFYNDSICECHKKDISSLAYCHLHRKLADIRNMCEGCLLAFATDKDFDSKFLQKDNDKKKTVIRCSCCGEFLKMRAASSPRACYTPTTWKTEDSRYTELICVSDTESDMSERIPGIKSNNFFGIPLTDSAAVSPKWANRIPKKMSRDKSDLLSETSDEDGDWSLEQIKKQARMDQKTLLVSLSRELDEERNAAAIAANTAMAMITRLQAEKAAVQMEALQYQRMMEEQADYDQEAIQILKDLVAKRDEYLKVMESELESYREKYGGIRRVGSYECEADADEYYQEWKSQSLSSYSEKSEPQSPLRDHDESGSPSGRDYDDLQTPLGRDDDESWTPLGRDRDEFGSPSGRNDKDGEGHSGRDTSLLDFETEKFQLYGMLKNLESHIQSSSMADEWDEEDKEIVQENRATLKREVSLIRERLRALEADSGFLKHTAMTLQKGEQGAELLTEIARHLRKLRDHSEDLNTTDA